MCPIGKMPCFVSAPLGRTVDSVLTPGKLYDATAESITGDTSPSGRQSLRDVPAHERGSHEFEIPKRNVKLGGRRTLPYAFTEHGVVMLSAVLNVGRIPTMRSPAWDDKITGLLIAIIHTCN